MLNLCGNILMHMRISIRKLFIKQAVHHVQEFVPSILAFLIYYEDGNLSIAKIIKWYVLL